MPRLSSAATQVVIGESGKPPALSPRCQAFSGARPSTSRSAAIVRQNAFMRGVLQSSAVAPRTSPATSFGWSRARIEAIGPPML